MTNIQEQIDFLFTVELQFRLASAVRLATTMKEQPLDLPQQWVHGHHRVEYKDIALRQDQADYAACMMQKSATFLMAVVIKDAIRVAIPDPKNSTDHDVQAAYQISRLIRNAFAHSPVNPIWSIDPDCRNKFFKIAGIISLNTTDIDGKPFDWKHYGGPLAILELCRFVRFEILKDIKQTRKEFPEPQKNYIQQGNLILKEINEAKDG